MRGWNQRFLPYHFHFAVRGGGTHFHTCETREEDPEEGKNVKQVGPSISMTWRIWKAMSGSTAVRGRSVVL